MARKRVSDPTPLPTLLVPRTEAADRITEQISKGQEIRDRNISSKEQLELTQSERFRWSDYNYELLQRIFSDASIAEEYGGFGGVSMPMDPTFNWLIQDFRSGIGSSISRLQSIAARLELIPEAKGVVIHDAAIQQYTVGKDVFIVHGHDEATKQAVARLISQLALNPVILHEQPNSGRSIIDKFEANAASATFAVVIMSPDDVGAPATNVSDLQPRARQNVIFELGYFLAKLGRERVCVLRKEDTEILSDYLGVVYVPVDNGGAWRYTIANEMKAAKINVDLNLIK